MSPLVPCNFFSEAFSFFFFSSFLRAVRIFPDIRLFKFKWKHLNISFHCPSSFIHRVDTCLLILAGGITLEVILLQSRLKLFFKPSTFVRRKKYILYHLKKKKKKQKIDDLEIL